MTTETQLNPDFPIFVLVAFALLACIVLICRGCLSVCCGLRRQVPPKLPLTMSSQGPEVGEASDDDVNRPPPYSRDGGGEQLVLPPPGVIKRVSGESDWGGPHPSTLLPMYIDEREVTVPTLPQPVGTATGRYRC